MKRILLRTLVGLLIIAALSYPVDWAVWKLRVSHGNGMGKVQVISVVAAEMKNNKEEYYLGDVNVVDCSYSLFPQAGSGACWWLQRHRQVVDRY
ncbi:hypothetical protein [Granulicella mallensis]|jgi:hypothetical protein|uniref:Uncharacterized protein n=1 Tax=Granulicella mallensis (strain ATCC BAA-1857 / DSM 23137 / MP5ACTX8) TaxID=682795 RepID=G8NYN6_GRAMM|nr:hypothetical protein [Granulicella mallensis]AEU39095.1 hypothetical protein AciX8_4826 [Granulicella mallensis MP5ACTX8]